jgi:hypothetical protein
MLKSYGKPGQLVIMATTKFIQIWTWQGGVTHATQPLSYLFSKFRQNEGKII